MKWRMGIFAWLVWFGFFVACDKKSKTNQQEDLTIVVEADRSKIEGEEKMLQQKLSEFEQERERMRSEKADLMSTKERLKGKDRMEGKRLLELEKKLWQKEQEMWKREAALEKTREQLAQSKSEIIDRIAGKGTSDVAVPAQPALRVAQREKSIAARESEIASREKDLAKREAELAKREADFLKLQSSLVASRIPAFPRATGPGRLVNPTKAEQAYKAVLKKMSSRGILLSDLPLESVNLGKEIKEAKKERDFARMVDLVEQLDTVVSAIEVNAEFIDRKFQRLAQLTREQQPAEKDKQTVSALLRKATSLYGDGKFSLANKELNRILALLTR